MAKKKIFRDPVHGTVALPQGLLVDLMSTPIFQRLRHIRQLGMCFTTFHGAEHSRFQHALGVAHLAGRVLQNWQDEGWLRLPEEEQQATLAAALLHDIGHGPFSHALERVFTGLSHESLGHSLIVEDLHEVFQAHGVDPKLVVAILQGSHSRPLLHDLVSGSVDVDRMDYLLRDSLYTGVKYGLFDSERILHCLVPLREQESGLEVLALQRKGVEAVEEFLFSRYFMYWQVYFHPTVRAAESVMRLALERARELWWADRRPPLPHNLQFLFEASSESGQLTLDFGGGEETHEGDRRRFLRAFVELDDADIFYALKMWRRSPDPILADLSARVRDRRLFKALPHPGNPEVVEEIREVVRRRFGDAHRYYLVEDKPHHGSGPPSPIRVENGPGLWVELRKVSKIHASTSLETTGGSGYLLFPAECREEIERIVQLSRATEPG